MSVNWLLLSQANSTLLCQSCIDCIKDVMFLLTQNFVNITMPIKWCLSVFSCCGLFTF